LLFTIDWREKIENSTLAARFGRSCGTRGAIVAYSSRAQVLPVPGSVWLAFAYSFVFVIY
ncbi:MAG: hypothetical protein ACTIKD_14265, partial [Sphingobacteriaceae bacterium]